MGTQDRKLAELVLYIATKCETDDSFGATKLNKILFFADFLAYAHSGASITDQKYQKLEHGPGPKRLLPVRDALLESGDCVLARRNVFGKTQKRLVALREAELTEFTAADIAIVDEVIERLRDHDGKGVSDLSHRFLGWQLADVGEEIPYETVFLGIRPLSETEKDRAEAIHAARA